MIAIVHYDALFNLGARNLVGGQPAGLLRTSQPSSQRFGTPVSITTPRSKVIGTVQQGKQVLRRRKA